MSSPISISPATGWSLTVDSNDIASVTFFAPGTYTLTVTAVLQEPTAYFLVVGGGSSSSLLQSPVHSSATSNGGNGGAVVCSKAANPFVNIPKLTFNQGRTYTIIVGSGGGIPGPLSRTGNGGNPSQITLRLDNIDFNTINQIISGRIVSNVTAPGGTPNTIQGSAGSGGGGVNPIRNNSVYGEPVQWSQFVRNGHTYGNNNYYANGGRFFVRTPRDTSPSALTVTPGSGGNLIADKPTPGSDGICIIQYFWPVPISNICFKAGTPIKTDQGLISIDKINPNIHTIHNNKIEAITQTISSAKYLVCFEKHSLGFNYPSKKTIISKNHKLFYKGKMLEASKFVGHFDGVYKMEYNNEILYNVLMDNYYTMEVNNLICETLHPSNIIAKLHKSFYSEEDKTNIIIMMNDAINKNDYSAYKKIASRL